MDKNTYIGFYWNGNQYNKVIKYDGQKFSPITPTIVTSNYCEGRYNELIDTGFNLIFCNGDSEVINLNSNGLKSFYTKGVKNTLFSQTDTYYALARGNNILVVDDSVSCKLKK